MLKFEICAQVISQVGGFSPDIADFGADCMSGLKPPTYNFDVCGSWRVLFYDMLKFEICAQVIS